ncbi:MAG: NADH-quinone oxidoreductase subunit N [Ferruginibacter sp.]
MNAIILSAVWGIVMMFSAVFIKSKTVPKYLALLGIGLIFLVNALELYKGWLIIDMNVKDMIRTNSFNLAFIAVAVGCTAFYFLLSGRDVEKVGPHVAEYFALIFFSVCGVAISATFNTLLFLFLGIEIMSIPLYILTGSEKGNLKSNEAALKYFLMGTFSTGIMLMGIAFLYGGTPNASFFINNLQIGTGQMTPMIVTGMLMLIVSMSFKVSAAPFHFWTPDVYDGAPTVFTSFMSTIVKVAGFFAFLRLFENSFGSMHSHWQKLIVFITVSTLLIGNITAIFQQSVKRMLAYSSIAQAGFMLLALFAMNEKAREGLVLYAAAYSLATIGLFAILIKMNDFTIEGFNGLSQRQPILAFTATVFLLSLTGIPLTAGFQSKFYMLIGAVENGHHFWVVIVAVIFAAISAYYYFRIIQAIYFKEPAKEEVSFVWDITIPFKIMLVLTAVLIVVTGIYPEWIIGWLYF